MNRAIVILAVVMTAIGTSVALVVLPDSPEEDAGNLLLSVGSVSTEDVELDHLNVTFSKARAHVKDGDDDWTEVELNDTPVDLAQLDKANATSIANLTLKDGTYNKIELYVEDVVGQLDGEEVEVFVPSGKLKIIGDIEVKTNQSTEFDFDVRLVQRGHQDVYNLLPVISKRGGSDGAGDGKKGRGDADAKAGSLHVAIGASKADIGDFASLNVTFDKVRIHTAGNNTTESNWTEKALNNVTVDLTNLTSTNATIVSNLSLAAGNYSKIELFVSKVVGIVSGVEVEVFVPSGKLKIVGDFEVKTNASASFVFDIHVVQRGKQAVYNLLPVIAKNS
jgi:hypothetical protein